MLTNKQTKHTVIHPDELWGSKNRNKTFNISTEGKQTSHMELIIRLSSEVQTAILNLRTQWKIIFKVFRSLNTQPNWNLSMQYKGDFGYGKAEKSTTYHSVQI